MTSKKRAAIYTRISRDWTGDAAGVARQEQDCRALVERHGWTVVDVFADNDTSAYSKKPRPGYRALLTAIEAGAVDAVVVWHTDRLYRRMPDLEEYIATCQPRNVPTYAVQSGPLDLATPSGRMIARQLGAVAQYESEQKAERQKRANLQRAQAGRYFGTRRPFGYEDDGVTIRVDEAVAVRQACEWFLDGISLGEIARRWNARGFRTPQAGNEWTTEVLARTLQTERIAGMRTYRREIVRDENGEPVRVEWPPLIDVDTWRAVQSKFADPDRKFPHASRLLLSGVAVCAACGGPIQSGGTRNGRRRYRCRQNGAHVYREAAPIDDYVEALVVERMTRPDGLDALTPAASKADVRALREEIETVRRRDVELAEAYADGVVTLAQLKAGRKRAEGRISELEARLPVTGSPALRRLAESDDVAATWAGLDVDTRRLVVDQLMRVELLAPGTKENAYLDWRRRILNPETVRVTWRDADDLATVEPITRRTIRKAAER